MKRALKCWIKECAVFVEVEPVEVLAYENVVLIAPLDSAWTTHVLTASVEIG